MFSISIDVGEIMTQGSSFFNSIWPVMVVPLGLIAGIGIFKFMYGLLRNIFGNLGGA